MENPDNIAIYTLWATIMLAVLGWIIALILQRKNLADQHRVQIKYDIYKQLVVLHQETQDSIGRLAAQSSPPFILMKSSMIPFELGLKKEYKGQWIPQSEQECLFEGEKKWTLFVQELQSLHFEFFSRFLKMLYVTEDWESAIKSLLQTKQVLSKEVHKLKEEIYELIGTLRDYSNKHGHDWRKWDQPEVEKITRRINENSLTIGHYLHDFMVLIHNALVSSYFGHKRPIRKTLDPKYKVLMRNGIVENVDWPMVRKTEKWKAEIVTYAKEQLKKFESGDISPEYKKFLTSVTEGVCPSCNTEILVLEAEKKGDGFCYRYACGHSWQGVTLKETVGIRELLKLKLVREGMGRIRRIVQGWKRSGDPKLKDGVDVYMDVNKEKNEYHQIVKNHGTGEVLHEEHEALTDHESKR